MTTSTFKRLAIPAALVVGGVTAGSFLSPIGLASAQDGETDSTDSTDSTVDDTVDGTAPEPGADDAGHQHRHGRFGAKAEVVEDVLGLSSEEIRAGLTDGKTLADLAGEQGVSSDDLTAALVAAAEEHIDEAVADGKLDADEAEERKAGLDDRIADLITRTPTERGEGEGMGRGTGRRGPGPGLDVAEDVLGLTAEEIRAGLDEGKTLADLAEEQGVAVEDLADAMATSAMERLDQAVEDGKIDADRAADAKENLDEMIDKAINAEAFTLGRMAGHRDGAALRRHHRMDHQGGEAPDAGSTAESGADGAADGGGSVEDANF